LNNKENGIFFEDSYDNIFSQNRISSNDIGIFITYNTDRNTFFENLITNNFNSGISIESDCDTNSFYHNNIIDNFQQANDTGANQWNDGNGEGNYWSDYIGLDNGANNRTAGDGIGDTNIPHLGLDDYPIIIEKDQSFILDDNDSDLIPDFWEIQYNFNSTDFTDAQMDYDKDNLTNIEEYLNKTEPTNWDSDNDGLSDGDEVKKSYTNPNNPDSDGDGYNDRSEIENDTDPLNNDDFPEKKGLDSDPLDFTLYIVLIVIIIIILVLLLLFSKLKLKRQDGIN